MRSIIPPGRLRTSCKCRASWTLPKGVLARHPALSILLWALKCRKCLVYILYVLESVFVFFFFFYIYAAWAFTPFRATLSLEIWVVSHFSFSALNGSKRHCTFPEDSPAAMQTNKRPPLGVPGRSLLLSHSVFWEASVINPAILLLFRFRNSVAVCFLRMDKPNR